MEVDEAHFGPMGVADASDPASDSLVVLIYNVQDAFYYDCDSDTYTAGYFAPLEGLGAGNTAVGEVHPIGLGDQAFIGLDGKYCRVELDSGGLLGACC